MLEGRQSRHHRDDHIAQRLRELAGSGHDPGHDIRRLHDLLDHWAALGAVARKIRQAARSGDPVFMGTAIEAVSRVRRDCSRDDDPR